MKITYISHATLLIEIGQVKIVTDPWVKGTAYCNQWYLFPRAIEPHLIEQADYVLFSHGHEDHLHPPSLQMINTRAQLFYPYSWFGGTCEFFNVLGFQSVREIKSEETVELTKNIRVTYLANNLDTVMVIEAEGQVIVNINDALPSASAAMIGYFVRKIKSRWPKIDYLFSSYGGASYFPNTVHAPEKNDVEIAQTREVFFLKNFCRIADSLSPECAIPFGSDFILLDDNQRWINTTKFPRYKIKEFYEEYAPSSKVKIIEAYPGDKLEQGAISQLSPYHQWSANLLDRIDEEYAEEIAEKRTIRKINDEEVKKLFAQVEQHVVGMQDIIPPGIRSKIKFSIEISDAVSENILTIDFRQAKVQFSQSQIPPLDIDLRIEIKSTTLLYAIQNEWGGDAIIIGYGAEIFLSNTEVLDLEFENYCIRLLSRYPNTRKYLKKTPLRTLKYLWSDKIKRNNLVYAAFGMKHKVIDYFDKQLAERSLWLSKSKCEVCKACNI